MVGISESLIYAWFDRSHIEYRDLFMRLYVAYNAWYRKVTGKSNDREAIAILGTRFVIWDEYTRGVSLVKLRRVMTQIAIHTKNRPMPVESGYWNGIVRDSDDWKGLISFWYEVRCGLFHGSSYALGHTSEVQYAYESLYIFMDEVVRRMKGTFHGSDALRLDELKVLAAADTAGSERYRTEAAHLQQKFITSPDLWNVDMARVRKE